MRLIPLTKDYYTLVDDADYDILSQYKWRILTGKGSFVYACRSGDEPGDCVLMHREVNETPDGLHTDHINHNTLDNRRHNLRTVIHRENCQNKKASHSSRYTGVSWSKRDKRWTASIKINYKTRHLGNFKKDDEVLAAIAYMDAVKDLYAC